MAPPISFKCWSLLLLLVHTCTALTNSYWWDGEKAPSIDDKIAVVGSGPAGLHMAYLLKQLNFEKITILEKTNRVGGRSVSLTDSEGIVHEMGTCYTNGDYTELYNMVSKLNINVTYVSLPFSDVVIKTAISNQHVPLMQYLFQHLQKLHPDITDDSELEKKLTNSLSKYINLRHYCFGSPLYEIPLTWENDNKCDVDMSVQQFLQHHNIAELEPLFIFGMTAMGYGFIDKISILYGFLWMTPTYISEIVDTDRESTKMFMIKEGFGYIWKEVVYKLDLNVKLNVDIKKIVRRRYLCGDMWKLRPCVEVHYSDGSVENYDFLIWAGGIDSELLSDDSDVAKFSDKLSKERFATTIVSMDRDSGHLNKPIRYWVDRLYGHGSTCGRWAERNSKAALYGLTESSSKDSYVVYQYGNFTSAHTEEFRQCLLRQYGHLLNVQLGATFNMRFFPHFTIEEMSHKVLWNIFDELQGSRHSWFIGYSVIFDSVKSVTKYNKLILTKFYPNLTSLIASL